MLFEASTVYAPGEPHGDVPYSNYRNMAGFGRYDLAQAVNTPNVWIGVAVLVAALWLGHKVLYR